MSVVALLDFSKHHQAIDLFLGVAFCACFLGGLFELSFRWSFTAEGLVRKTPLASRLIPYPEIKEIRSYSSWMPLYITYKSERSRWRKRMNVNPRNRQAFVDQVRTHVPHAIIKV